ncbi:hypothetical protein [uncultured Roseobacter sp.]|uniref:hypothetical protein n=1 Tax=uncultured Roseobacter sp. TaxID=114847 RepID=UPI002635DF7D|nr:hypothetical protein [uncultured Roseobacter sp.]
MSRLTGVIGAVVLSAATAAYANPITVRSGDHAGFTRLVMDMPADSQWELSETRGLATVTFPNHESGFDVRRVFDIIPRDQLTDVRSYGSRLELELACACTIRTFVERGEYLVIDIRDGPALPISSDQVPPEFVPVRPASRFNYGDLLWSGLPAPESVRGPSRSEVSTSLEPINPSREDNKELANEIVNETRETLLHQMSDASSRGILQLAAPDMGLELRPTSIDDEPEMFNSSAEPPVPAIPGPGNIRITNSRDSEVSGAEPDLSISGSLCENPNLVAVPSWGTNEPLSRQVSQLRMELYTEVGEVNSTAALKLARLYVFFGLGSEAKEVLRLSPVLSSKHPEIFDLASIMEFGSVQNPRFVHRFSDCDSPLALWSILAGKKIPSDQIVNVDAALRALSALPDHLKLHIAPALSKRLSAYGDLAAASIALRNVDYRQDESRSSFELAEATIKQLSGETNAAEDLLSDVIDENSPETPQALISMIDSGLQTGKVVPADIALLIESYAFERRQGTDAKEIMRAHVLASAYSGQFIKAIENLDSPTIKGDEALIAELRSHIFIALSSGAENIDFLNIFFSEYPVSSAALLPKAVEKVAERLIMLGFPEPARRVLSSIPVGEKTSLLLELEGLALVETAQPQEALLVLEGLDSVRANEVRAQAKLQLGDGSAAYELFELAENHDEAVRSAWLAEEWAQIIESDIPVLGDMRSVSEQPVVNLPMRDGMLISSDVILRESAESRSILEEALQGFVVSQ